MANFMGTHLPTINFMRSLKLCGRTLGMAVVFSLLTLPAYSEILLGVTRTTPVIYGNANYLVDWNGGAAGGTTHYFQTTEPNTMVVISFNAECVVMEGGNEKWVGIDIVVDPAGPAGDTVAAPSNSDNALCSGNYSDDGLTGSGDGWVSAMTQTIIVLPEAGQHSVKVRVKGQFSEVARLDDMSLVVQR